MMDLQTGPISRHQGIDKTSDRLLHEFSIGVNGHRTFQTVATCHVTLFGCRDESDLGEWAIALHGRGTRPSVGFRTGNPWVRFSHTVPVPTNTVPVTGTTRTRPVNCAVSNETRSIHDTRGYISLKWCSTCT